MKQKSTQQPFNTPEGYFENFGERLKGKLAQPKSVIPKNSGFTVPQGYFEELLGQLDERRRPKAKVIPLHPYKKHIWIAASVAVLVLLAVGLGRELQPSITFEDLAHEDIEAYLENNDLGLSPYEIAEFLPLEDVPAHLNLSEEQMLEYLTNHVDHINELNLENDD